MRILGIADGQTSGAAVVEDGRILAAINEERICRIKMARGFPRESIREVMALTGTDSRHIGGVAIATENMEFREEIAGWPGWFEARNAEGDTHSRFFQLASKYGRLAHYVPGLKLAYYALRTPAYTARRRRIREILASEYAISAPIRYVNHHYAHATSAYFTSNFDDALVVTMDGGGDGHSSHVYSVRNGRFERLATTDSYDSLGNYYAYVTVLCGFKAKRHEGKVTGLAARGKPVYRDLFDRMIACQDGRVVNRGRVLFQGALEEISRQLPSSWTMEDLSATIQVLSEDITRDYIRHWCRRTGHRSVAVAGGLFSNVRINEEVHLLEEVDRIFVHPGMSDEGLAVGAALALQEETDRRLGRRTAPRELPDVYLGNAYDEHAIAGAIREAGLSGQHLPGGIEPRIADLLAEGKVVARFHGRMEYGPRALGNRSILYQPGDPSVNDWLNELLRRTEFMPFAPSSLEDASADLYRGLQGAEDTARFMTITFHCTPFMAEHCAGVVHVDGTARPQIVRERDNPSYHRIIHEYRKRTGVPVIVNTSFNIHEEPIVRTPADAIRAFVDSALDYIALGDFLVRGPVGSEATRRKWEGRSKWGRRVDSPTSR